MIELCFEYLSVRCIWQYVLVMLRTSFRLNPHSIVAWMSCAYFEEGVPWPSGNYGAWIHSETTWHDKNIQSYLNLLVFISDHFSGVFLTWVTISVKIRRKQNYQDFRVFDLGYRSKSKTRKSRKSLFFLLIRIGTVQFFAQFIFLSFLNLEL